MSGVVLSAHGRIITAMETGGLYFTRTLHTLFLQMIKILHVLCLSLSSHYGFKSSNGRVQFVHASLLSKMYPTTAGLNARGKEAKTIKINAIF